MISYWFKRTNMGGDSKEGVRAYTIEPRKLSMLYWFAVLVNALSVSFRDNDSPLFLLLLVIQLIAVALIVLLGVAAIWGRWGIGRYWKKSERHKTRVRLTQSTWCKMKENGFVPGNIIYIDYADIPKVSRQDISKYGISPFPPDDIYGSIVGRFFAVAEVSEEDAMLLRISA